MMRVKLLVVVAVVVADQLLLASASCTLNGTTFVEGTTYQPDPCTNCSCSGGQPMCMLLVPCEDFTCVDMVHDPTQCCPKICPNGPNCRAPNGTIIPDGESYWPHPCQVCRCMSGYPNCRILECFPPLPNCIDLVREPNQCCYTCRKYQLPVTTASTSCTWNGHTFAEGTTYQPDTCTSCTCSGGQTSCTNTNCAPPPCIDMVYDPHQCCPVCPHGPNCRAPDGTTIPRGQGVTLADGRHCRCSDGGLFMYSSECS